MALDSEKILDGTGWRILRELQENARITFTELAQRVALTPPAVSERVRRMEEAGIIAGYRVQLDAEKVGLPITAFIRVTTSGGGNCARLGALVRDLPEVLECHRVTGGDSYVMKVVVRSVPALQELIDRLMPYGEPTTSIVLSSPVTHRTVAPAGERPGDRRSRRPGRARE